MNPRPVPHDDNQVSLVFLSLIAVVLILLFSLVYPALNWPDEIYKISTLYSSENLYLRGLDWLQGSDCGFSYTSLASGIYGTNKFEFQILSGVECYRETKLFNALLIIVIIACCLPFLRKDKWQIFLMSLIWPSSIFFLTSVNNQVVFHVIAIALGVYSLYARALVVPIVLSLLLIVVDRSFITTLIFFSIMQAFRINGKLTVGIFVALLIFSQLTGDLFETLYGSIMGQDAVSLSSIQESNETYRDSFFFSLAVLGLSFVYLGGTASVFGIGLDYLLVYGYLTRSFFNLEDKKNVYIFLLSLLFTLYLVLQFVPSIQSFRYYVFIMPIIISYFLKPEHRKYYIYYCVLMSVIYLFLAYFVQGATL